MIVSEVDGPTNLEQDILPMGPAFESKLRHEHFPSRQCARCSSSGYLQYFLFNAPNFEEVEGAYWFHPVRLSVTLSCGAIS